MTHAPIIHWVTYQELFCLTYYSLDHIPVRRNVLSKQACEELLQRAGLNNNTTLILYGDFNNWFAAFAFWVFKYYGYDDVRLMNGGRKKWLLEDRPVSKGGGNHTN
ncbi:MAG: rhodanese-like domain-containing protein [Candidatus Nitrosopolaris sp.]